MREQLTALVLEARLASNDQPWWWWSCWFRADFWACATYRVDHACWLRFGRRWLVVRVLLRPLFAVLQPSTVDIHYKAEIGPGMRISHPGLGLVISGEAHLGERVVFTGGNCVGVRDRFRPGDPLVIGDRVIFGANAVVLGPVRVADDVVIGAGAVVTRDVPEGAAVAGVPATVRSRTP